MSKGPYDPVTVQLIMDYESGDLDEPATVRLFQELINTGLAWQLQGHYGRTAHDLLSQGICTPPAGAGGLRRS